MVYNGIVLNCLGLGGFKSQPMLKGFLSPQIVEEILMYNFFKI